MATNCERDSIVLTFRAYMRAGAIPTEIGRLRALTELTLQGNMFDGASVPSTTWVDLPGCGQVDMLICSLLSRLIFRPYSDGNRPLDRA